MISMKGTGRAIERFSPYTTSSNVAHPPSAPHHPDRRGPPRRPCEVVGPRR